MSRGKYLCGLSTDDIMLPNRISTGVEILRRSSQRCAAAYSDAYLIDQNGHRAAATYRPGPRPSGDIFEALLQDCFIPAPSVMIRTQTLRETGPYDSNIVLEDYDMWLRVAARYEFAYGTQPLVEYRQHDHNFSKSVTRFNEQLYWIYRKHINREPGERRFLDHYALMAARGELREHVIADFRTLPVKRPPLARTFFSQILKNPGKVYRIYRGLMRGAA